MQKADSVFSVWFISINQNISLTKTNCGKKLQTKHCLLFKHYFMKKYIVSHRIVLYRIVSYARFFLILVDLHRLSAGGSEPIPGLSFILTRDGEAVHS